MSNRQAAINDDKVKQLPSPSSDVMEDAALRQYQQTIQENRRLKSTLEHMESETAQMAGQNMELRAQNMRLQQDCDHYKTIAIASATAVAQLYEQATNIHHSMPAIEPVQIDIETSQVLSNLRSDRKTEATA
jgi:hypothetical protein